LLLDAFSGVARRHFAHISIFASNTFNRRTFLNSTSARAMKRVGHAIRTHDSVVSRILQGR
jgi:hypothetical protein